MGDRQGEGAPRAIGPLSELIVQPLPPQPQETADVSPLAVTVREPKLLFYLRPSGNRTQEADGSIPFSSTTSFGIFSAHSGEKTFEDQTFFIQAALSSPFFPPASTVRTFSWRALAPAPALA